MNRKYGLCVLALAGILALTGCGENEQPVDQTVEEQVAEATEELIDEVSEIMDDAQGEEETVEDTAEEAVGDIEEAEPVDLDSISSVEFAKLLKLGWNLGNTLDATGSSGLDSETSWQQPVTTQEMISFIKESGFTSIRIPVSWGKHTDENYQIDPAWMARVKEIVDYAYNADLYIIINSHHDNDYYYPSEENLENAKKYIATVWEQIAEEFKDYDNHLVFESMNEPRLAGTDIEWWFNMTDPEGQAAIGRICQLNQVFVDTVRAGAGNNPNRFIMVPSYAASQDFALNRAFSMPEDPSNRLMLSIHAYTPYDFAGKGTGYSEWNPEKNSEFVFMGKLMSNFIANGYGVVIGEFGATNKDNLEDRVKWAKGYCGRAAGYGISCFVWDNGAIGVGEENFGLIDRRNLKVYFPELLEAYKMSY